MYVCGVCCPNDIICITVDVVIGISGGASMVWNKTPRCYLLVPERFRMTYLSNKVSYLYALGYNERQINQ